MIDVAVIGSLNLDLVARTGRLPGPGETVTGSSFHEYPGGKGLNQAVAAARSGARVAMFGALGDDDAGRALRQVARDAGIDESGVIELADAASGRAVIAVDDRAENSIIVIPGANHHVPQPRLPSANLVLAQLEVPIDVVIAGFTAARSAGSTTVLNPAPAQRLPSALLAVTDIVVPNEHEVDLLGGSEALRAAGVATVIVTQGARGVTITDDDGVRHRSAFAVDTVDTTGAGDAFCGSLAAKLATGASFDASVRWAIVAGALATTIEGAVPSLPTARQISEAIAATSR